MKLFMILCLSVLMISCQIHYMKTIPAEEPQPEIIVIYPVDPSPALPGGPVRPEPVITKPVSVKPEKVSEDNNKKRPEKPQVQRPERPVSSSSGAKKETKSQTR